MPNPPERDRRNSPVFTDDEERQIELAVETRRRAAKRIREDVAAETKDREHEDAETRKTTRSFRDLV